MVKVKVDQAEAEPTMAAEIATAVFMVVTVLPSAKEEQRSVAEPAKIFHIALTSTLELMVGYYGWLCDACIHLHPNCHY